MSFAIYPSLTDRPVFISGGGSGIGASLVAHFAAQGAKVGFVDIDEAASQEVAGRTGASFRKCDIRDIAAYQATIADLAGELGPFRGLLKNSQLEDRKD